MHWARSSNIFNIPDRNFHYLNMYLILYVYPLCLNHGWCTKTSWSIPDRNFSNGLELKSPNKGSCSACALGGSSVSICEFTLWYTTEALPSCDERKLASWFWWYGVLIVAWSCCRRYCISLFKFTGTWTPPQSTLLTNEFAIWLPSKLSISSCKLAICTQHV